MINAIIAASLQNRALVLIFSAILGVLGWQAWQKTPLDAIPDLSDVQVIIKTTFAGQSPQVVEDQVTYPLSSLMMSVPKAKAVRGYSFFGDSYIYVLFEEGTDAYWARTRVLEYLSQAKSALPESVQPELGPDASGVGWVYEYALVDRTNQHDLSDLRRIQDWFLKFELQSVAGVSEIATIGGMVKQYQVIVDPLKLSAHNLTLAKVQQAIKESSSDVGASVIEQAEAEYLVRFKSFVTSIEDLEQTPVGIVNSSGIPLLLKDVAKVQVGPQMRRGIAELDGEGEVVGGIVVMRSGENALKVIEAAKQKLETLKLGLPEGVEIIETYDRSLLIERAVDHAETKLLQEMLVVGLVCLVFLWHFPSAFVAFISLPLGVLGAFIVMQQMGITANIMSLGGIAIAIGAMVDASIVMIENTHRRLEMYYHQHGRYAEGKEHWQVVLQASQQVGGALFFSLLIIALSFVPIFALEEQAGRLFSPLAFTKTLSMAVAAGLAISLTPVLLGYFVRGKLPRESKNPLSRVLIWIYEPLLKVCLRFPKSLLVVAFVFGASLIYPWQKIGSEFMPELNEGDLMYMPTTLPGLSIGAAQTLLQDTDRLIKSVPEVKRVFGKIGRAETATDPAPLTMIETTIQLKDKTEWRVGMTLQKIIAELDQTVQLPGVTNAWVQPIKTRIDMLSTGIKTPIGIKIAGEDLATIQAVGEQLESQLRKVPNTLSAFADRVEAGRYVEIIPDRTKAARYGLNMAELANILSSAVGGVNLASTLEGRERYGINLRYPQSWRDSVEKLQLLPIVTMAGAQLQLGQVAEIKVVTGPALIKSENARLNGWVFVDIAPETDIAQYVQQAKAEIEAKVKLPVGVSLTWTGEYESLLKVEAKMYQIVPITLLIILILLYFIFRNFSDALMILAVLPFALTGSIWILHWLDYQFSVAVAVGIIALAGVAAEFGVVMLLYLNNAIEDAKQANQLNTRQDLWQAIMVGAVQRIRPKAMTVSVILLGLLPIMLGDGSGAEVMQRIAAPMIGGMISAPLVSLFMIPVLVYLKYRNQYQNTPL